MGIIAEAEGAYSQLLWELGAAICWVFGFVAAIGFVLSMGIYIYFKIKNPRDPLGPSRPLSEDP